MSLKNTFLEEFTEELILNSLSLGLKQELEEKNKLRENQLNLLLAPKLEFKEELEEKPEEEIDLEEEELKEKLKLPEGDFSLGRIESILLDDSVISIECAGPGRYLLINRRGRNMPVHMSLTKQEIEDILNYFSKETRIPRIGGIFKAILNNMIITAIDSEFAGPRFIITKMMGTESRYL